MKRNILFVICLFSLLFAGGYRYSPNSPMLDQYPTAGLTGTPDSIAYRVEEIEKHMHNRERWFGISGDQSGDDWAADNMDPFIAASGDDTYGTAIKILGIDDTPAIAGGVKYDIHRVMVESVDHGTPYKLRVIYGSGTSADALTAGQCTETVVQFDATNPNIAAGVPLDILMPRGTCGVTKIWVQAWNATDASEIDFLVGIHEYEG